MYKPGDWAFYCDVCKKRLYASQGKKRWDGLMVCMEDWEMRHPMDFLKSRKETITVAFARPDDGAGRTSYTPGIYTDNYLGRGPTNSVTFVGDVHDGGDNVNIDTALYMALNYVTDNHSYLLDYVLTQAGTTGSPPYIMDYVDDGYTLDFTFQIPYYVLSALSGLA